jgi:FG-GAP-like repeat
MLQHMRRLGRSALLGASGAAVLLVAVALGVAAPPAPAPSFAEPKHYAVARDPDELVSGDLDGDGDLDLVTATSKGVSVLLNRGDGTFPAPRGYRAGGNHLAIGDLNADGRLDLATTAALLRNPHVSVLLNKGNGTFRSKRDYRTGRGPTSVAIGDLNGDGTLDLATANMYSTVNSKVYTASVLLNRGGGRFRPPRDYRTGANPEAIEIGDMNGDRKLDLVTANEGDTVSVLPNSGGGRFRSKRDYRTGPSPTDAALGDLNADGKLDVVTPNLNSIDTGPPRISVLLNKGNGSLRARRDYRTGWIYSVAVGDLNGDRKPDLVVGSSSGFPSVLLNRGDGTFQAMIQYRVQAKLKYNSAGGEWAAIGDLNGDGKVDLATSNNEDHNVSVLINTPGLCNVQNVRRMTLPAAARLLARVNCSLGEVRRDDSAAFKRGDIMWQKPALGAVRPNGDKVAVVVSLGRKQ